MGWLSDIRSALEGLAASGIKDERMALLRDRFEQAHAAMVELQEENRRLVQENQELHRQLEEARVPEDFVEHRGVLLRRLPDGDYEPDVYCPRCKVPMFSVMDHAPFQCGRCGEIAGFTGQDLHRYLAQQKKRPT